MVDERAPAVERVDHRPAELVPVQTEQLRGGGIPVAESVLAVEQHHAVGDVLERAGGIAPPLGLGVQPRVVERDRDPARELLGELLLLGGQGRAPRGGADAEDAVRQAVRDEGHHHRRAARERLHQLHVLLALRRTHERAAVEGRQPHGLSGLQSAEDRAFLADREAAVQLADRLLLLGVPVSDGAEPGHAVLVEQVEGADADEARDRQADDELEHDLDLGRRREQVAGRGEHGGDLLAAPHLGDVPEVPDPAEQLSLGAVHRRAVALEDAAVDELDLVAAPLVRMVVEVGDPLVELVGLGQLGLDRLQGRGVGAAGDDLGRQLPQLDEPAVEREHPALGRDEQDPVRGRLAFGFEDRLLQAQLASRFRLGLEQACSLERLRALVGDRLQQLALLHLEGAVLAVAEHQRAERAIASGQGQGGERERLLRTVPERREAGITFLARAEEERPTGADDLGLGQRRFERHAVERLDHRVRVVVPGGRRQLVSFRRHERDSSSQRLGGGDALLDDGVEDVLRGVRLHQRGRHLLEALRPPARLGRLALGRVPAVEQVRDHDRDHQEEDQRAELVGVGDTLLPGRREQPGQGAKGEGGRQKRGSQAAEEGDDRDHEQVGAAGGELVRVVPDERHDHADPGQDHRRRPAEPGRLLVQEPCQPGDAALGRGGRHQRHDRSPLVLAVGGDAELLDALAAHLVALPAAEPLEHVVDDRAEGRGIERLRHVPDRPELVPVEVVGRLGARRQEDDRERVRGRIAQELVGNLPAVELRHHHVEEHEVGLRPTRELERLLAVARLDRVHALEPQVHTTEQADRGLVVDDEHERALARLGLDDGNLDLRGLGRPRGGKARLSAAHSDPPRVEHKIVYGAILRGRRGGRV